MRLIWQRLEQAPMTQLAVLFAIQAILVIPDPLQPHDGLVLFTLALLILGAVLKVVGRVWDNRRRVWPLHIESAGNAFVAAGFILLATRAAEYAQNGWEVGQAYFGYGALAAIFLVRLWLLRKTLRLIRKGP